MTIEYCFSIVCKLFYLVTIDKLEKNKITKVIIIKTCLIFRFDILN